MRTLRPWSPPRTLAPRATSPIARPRRLAIRIAIAFKIAIACLAPTLALAQPSLPTKASPVTAPTPETTSDTETARRTVKVFTFDDPDNPEPVPPGWVRAQDDPRTTQATRPGFPEFNKAELDQTQARSGTTSIRLPTQGGSTSLRLKAGEISLFADADYIVTGFVKTSNLRHARAFISARMLDQRLEAITGSEVRSQPVLSADAWTPVKIRLPGRFKDAAWLQLDLELLQPLQFAPAQGAPSAHTVWREDISGAAWFDDVGVFQVPRARMWTASPVNILSDQLPPTLNFSVRDLAGQSLAAELAVLDADDRLVDSSRHLLDPGARPTSWTPRLPGPGWYSAQMDIFSDNILISRSVLWLCIVADKSLPLTPRAAPQSTINPNDIAPAARSPRAPSPPRAARPAALPEHARFGIIAEDLSEAHLADLPAVLDAVGSGACVIPIFDPLLPLDQMASLVQNREAVYKQLLEAGQTLTLALPAAPAQISSSLRISPSDTLSLLSKDQSLWLPYFEPTLDIYGQRLARFQPASIMSPLTRRRELSTPLSAFELALGSLVPAPFISLPWRADWDFPAPVKRQPGKAPAAVENTGPLLDAVCLLIPAGFAEAAIAPTAQRWLDARPDADHPNQPTDLTFVLELASSDGLSKTAPAIELTRKAIALWLAIGEPRENASLSNPLPKLAIRAPWRYGTQSQGLSDAEAMQLLPTPELLAFRTIIQQLADRRIIGIVPTPPGITAYVLAARSTVTATGLRVLERGGIVAWADGSAPSRPIIEVAPVGPSITLTDPFGKQTTLTAPFSPARDSLTLQASSPFYSTPSSALPIIDVPLTDVPVFIEGVDPYLAMFAASFQITPSFIPAVIAEHEQRLILTNHWPVRISGKLQVKESDEEPLAPSPPGSPSTPRRPRGDDWSVSPRGVIDFAIAPGQTTSIPFTVSLGPAQLAGRRDITVIAKVTADRPYPPIRLKAPVEIGLTTLDMNLDIQLSPTPTGPDVLVTVTVTNKDTRARTLRVDTAARNTPSQQAQIPDLAPGETAIRRFIFRDAAAALAGRRIIASLSDIETAERLNKAIAVP